MRSGSGLLYAQVLAVLQCAQRVAARHCTQARTIEGGQSHCVSFLRGANHIVYHTLLPPVCGLSMRACRRSVCKCKMEGLVCDVWSAVFLATCLCSAQSLERGCARAVSVHTGWEAC